jgi:eukaryotic-like serine/threonine-protein kinase
MTLSVGQLVGAKYELVEKLGEGGFGAVFRARDQLLGRDVAIKVMRVGAEDRETAMQRFFAEARTTSRLGHPNNVRVFDFGHNDDGQVYLVMEYVVGRPLSRLGTPLDPTLVLKIAIQVARALDEAHELGIVHRDLKPDNVMISEVDGQPFARVLDYGIAKLENSATGLTKTGGFIGTAEFAAPEQLRARPVDRRTDIYAFGVMLWSLLAGRPLFDAEDAISIAYMQVHEPPERLRDHAAVSASLESAIMRCLEKDPSARFGSMAELILVLGQAPEAVQGNGATQFLPAATTNEPTHPEATGFAATLSDTAVDPERDHAAETALHTTFATPMRRMLPLAAVLGFVVLGVGVATVFGDRAERESPPAPIPEPVAEVVAESVTEVVVPDEPPPVVTPPAVAPSEAQSTALGTRVIARAELVARAESAVGAAAAARTPVPAAAADRPPPRAPRDPVAAPAPSPAAPSPAAPSPSAPSPSPSAPTPSAPTPAAPSPSPSPSVPSPADTSEVSRRERLRQAMDALPDPAAPTEAPPSRRDRLEGIIGE